MMIRCKWGRSHHAIASTAAAAVVSVIGACQDTSAAEVDWEGGVTSVFQHADASRTNSELTASADLFATLKNSRGEWLVYIEASTTPRSEGVSAFYPTANGDARSVSTSDGSGAVQVSEFNYTFRADDNRSLMLGLIDPSARLDRSRIANDENRHFLNRSFVNNPTIEFPDYTLGAFFQDLGDGRRPEFSIVVAGSDGIADLPDRSYQDLLDFDDDGRGIFIGSDVGWTFGQSSWRIGAWARTDDRAVAGSGTEKEDNHGIYGVYAWESGPHAINVRAGHANADVSLAESFYAVAYQRSIRLGLFGIGVAHTTISSDYRLGERDNAFDSEVYFRVSVFGGAGHLTPSIQYVEVPGFNLTEPAPGSTALITSVRLHYSF